MRQKTNQPADGGMRDEYNFSDGVRGKYWKRLEGATAVYVNGVLTPAPPPGKRAPARKRAQSKSSARSKPVARTRNGRRAA